MQPDAFEYFSILFIATSLLTITATATASPIDDCDPATDPYNCTCSTDLNNLGQCALVEEANLPDYTIPSNSDLTFISTTYDSQRGLYVIEADLSQAPAYGLMKPHGYNGQWNSLTELHSYLNDLLGVPLNSSGYLKPFEYSQFGISQRYSEENEALLPSTGRFWLDAISDSNGDVWVNSSKHLAYGGSNPTVSCLPSYANNQVWSDQGSDSLHAVSAPNGDLEYDMDTRICANEHTGAMGHPGYFVDTKAKSAIHSTSVVLQFNQDREPLFECDSNWNCTVKRRVQLLPEGVYGNHMIRLFNLTMDDLEIDHTHFRGASSAFHSSGKTNTSGPRSDLLHTDDPPYDSSANHKDPVFDQVCGEGYARFGNIDADANYTKATLTDAKNPAFQGHTCP